MSYVPALPATGAAWVCAHCKREPGHVDDLEAFAAGYTSSRRELHGCDPFTVCAACVRVEAHDVYRANVEYWTGLGAAEDVVVFMLTRPA